VESITQEDVMLFNPGKVSERLQEFADSYSPLYQNTMEVRTYLREVYFEMEKITVQADPEQMDIRAMKIVMDAMLYSPHFGSLSNIICFRDIMQKLEKNDFENLQDVIEVGNILLKSGLNLAPSITKR